MTLLILEEEKKRFYTGSEIYSVREKYINFNSSFSKKIILFVFAFIVLEKICRLSAKFDFIMIFSVG